MSVRSAVRAMPTLMRIGFSEAVAYRAEMMVWVLSTTMPLVMLALWSAVARDAPVGRFGQKEFVAYFLSMFIVRQLTSSWAAWEMNFDIRQGTLAMRLLRPVSPVVHYAVENVAAMPMRMFVAIPVAIVALVVTGTQQLPRDWAIWVIWVVALFGAWLITFTVNILIGTLAFFMQSSVKVMDAWFGLYMLLSGYLFPLEFLGRYKVYLDYLPFRFQLALPVELMIGMHPRAEALRMLGIEYAWVAVAIGGAWLLWRAGLRRFQAFGG